MSNDEEGYTIIEKKGERSMVMTPTKDEKILATLIYVTSFFTTVIAPIIIWLLKREESTFIDHHGKENLNFAISYFVYGIVAAITVFVGIGVLLVPSWEEHTSELQSRGHLVRRLLLEKKTVTSV